MGKNSILKNVLIILLVVWALWTLWPTYRYYSRTPEQLGELDDQGKLIPLKEKAIHMGLDLQGGMYLTLEVNLPALIEELARRTDPRLEEMLEATTEELNVSSEDYLTILGKYAEENNIALSQYWGERGDSDGKVLSELQQEARDAMNRSLEILTNRIDQFGVSEPSIQKVGSRRILVQLPGISDPDEARTLIGKTALLEFKLVEEPTVYSRLIQRIDRALARDRSGLDESEMAESPADTSMRSEEDRASQDKVVSVSDLFGDEDVEIAEEDTAARDTSLLVDERIFEEHPFMAMLRTFGQGRHEVSAPVENINAINRILARKDIQDMIPPDVEFIWSSEAFRMGDGRYYRDMLLLKKETDLSGKFLTDARVTIGNDAESAGRPVVLFTLNREGARIIARLSGANIGKRLAIVLDNRVVSAPTIQSKLSASSRITGIPTMDEAKMIAIVLRAGALPAPVQIIEERTVGPSLGQDSIKSGAMSALVGLGLVVLFMFIYYRMAGLVADLALILNLVLLMAVLAQFRFVLTLPGVAGIVLTIGMAVDANVLVFERIREELRTGKTVRASIDAGYGRAFRTILDANVTTLLTALVLYQFGTGPIRGFAVTLSIGIVVSMFTALVVTRTIFNAVTARRTLIKLSI